MNTFVALALSKLGVKTNKTEAKQTEESDEAKAECAEFKSAGSGSLDNASDSAS